MVKTQQKTNAFVITHPEYGIFICNVQGLCFWSKLDCHGLNGVQGFGSQEQAKEFLQNTREPGDLTQYSIKPVVATREGGVSVGDLRRAGLSDLLGDLALSSEEVAQNRLRGWQRLGDHARELAPSKQVAEVNRLRTFSHEIHPEELTL